MDSRVTVDLHGGRGGEGRGRGTCLSYPPHHSLHAEAVNGVCTRRAGVHTHHRMVKSEWMCCTLQKKICCSERDTNVISSGMEHTSVTLSL